MRRRIEGRILRLEKRVDAPEEDNRKVLGPMDLAELREIFRLPPDFEVEANVPEELRRILYGDAVHDEPG